MRNSPKQGISIPPGVSIGCCWNSESQLPSTWRPPAWEGALPSSGEEASFGCSPYARRRGALPAGLIVQATLREPPTSSDHSVHGTQASLQGIRQNVNRRLFVSAEHDFVILLFFSTSLYLQKIFQCESINFIMKKNNATMNTLNKNVNEFTFHKEESGISDIFAFSRHLT